MQVYEQRSLSLRCPGLGAAPQKDESFRFKLMRWAWPFGAKVGGYIASRTMWNTLAKYNGGLQQYIVH